MDRQSNSYLDTPTRTHSIIFPSILVSVFIMCFWRRVNNIYTRCNHAIPLPDEHIDCAALNCKFSSMHPEDCVPPRCRTTCWQFHQFPQQYAPHIDNWCPACLQNGNAA